jgi:hypothetical protein
MIARIWHGYTKPEHADAYRRGSYLPRRKAGDEVEFITILIWDSIDAIRAVAGPRITKLP